VNKDRAITKKLVQHAESRGVKGLFITVDAPQVFARLHHSLKPLILKRASAWPPGEGTLEYSISDDAY
jgi:isopentenyl diphosphate isomerase/L-lactate dehydrogenase-like FMN-dependent dehydrogenase